VRVEADRILLDFEYSTDGISEKGIVGSHHGFVADGDGSDSDWVDL
jgi:hypothetical protein